MLLIYVDKSNGIFYVFLHHVIVSIYSTHMSINFVIRYELKAHFCLEIL